MSRAIFDFEGWRAIILQMFAFVPRTHNPRKSSRD